MIRAACHCEAVRFEFEAPPEWVLDCNCTLCRRYGALWGYLRGPGALTLLSGPTTDATDTYSWLDGDLAFHRCKTCGCVTHMMAAKVDPPAIYGVNMRLMAGLDPATVRVRRRDNGHSGFFWTRPDAPIEESGHPPMPPPGRMDWR
ncbi:MAG TPA: hypothetical protein VGI95_11020 [Caulobacteraceae bacterium]